VEWAAWVEWTTTLIPESKLIQTDPSGSRRAGLSFFNPNSEVKR
jgi:hypothetical protein